MDWNIAKAVVAIIVLYWLKGLAERASKRIQLRRVMENFDQEREERRTRLAQDMRTVRLVDRHLRSRLRKAAIATEEREKKAKFLERPVASKLDTQLSEAQAESFELQKRSANALEKRTARRLSKLKLR